MRTGTKIALIAAFASIAAAAIGAYATISSATRATDAANRADGVAKQTQSLLRYVYDNGSITSTSFAGGKMVISVNGTNNAGPAFTKIDMARFVDMCGDADGCTITMGGTRFREHANGVVRPDKIITAQLMGSPCRLHYDRQTKDWALSESCVAVYAVYEKVSDGAATRWQLSKIPYQPYYYATPHGRDDDGVAMQIASFRGGCYLAEAAPDTRKNGGAYLSDDGAVSTGAGLYLIVSSPDWDYPGAYPGSKDPAKDLWPSSDAHRRCVLIVDD